MGRSPRNTPMCPSCGWGKGTRNCDDGHYSCGTRVVDGEVQVSRRCERTKRQKDRERAWELANPVRPR